MEKFKRVIVIGSGGDAPGMNAFIDGLLKHTKSAGIDLYAGHGGYDGIVNDRIYKLENIGYNAQKAGCIIGAGRSHEFQTPEGVQKAIANIKKHEIDVVVVCGGNGSLKGAWENLAQNGVPVMGVPATIDNDVMFTDNSLGFSSSVQFAVEQIDGLRETMTTNNRHVIVEVMGRNAPMMADKIGVAGNVDLVDTVEKRYTTKQMAKFLLSAGENESKIVVVQEVKNGDVHTQNYASANYLQEVMTYMGGRSDSLRAVVLGHLQRGCRPTAHDRYLGFRYAEYVVRAIVTGNLNRAVGIMRNTNTVGSVPIEDANKGGERY